MIGIGDGHWMVAEWAGGGSGVMSGLSHFKLLLSPVGANMVVPSKVTFYRMIPHRCLKRAFEEDCNMILELLTFNDVKLKPFTKIFLYIFFCRKWMKLFCGARVYACQTNATNLII